MYLFRWNRLVDDLLFDIFFSCFVVDYFSVSHNSFDDLPIKEFLDNDDITILSALSQQNAIIFSHNVPAEENCLVFYKIPQIGINQNAADAPLGILTLEGGLTKSIYNSVSRVFSPHVTKVRGSIYVVLLCLDRFSNFKVEKRASLKTR